MVLNSGYLTSTNAKNHITTSMSTHLYTAAFNKRTLLNALSKLMYTAAWLCNQCLLLCGNRVQITFSVFLYLRD